MQHERVDSVMVHTTRRSYKQKYLELKANIPDVDEETKRLADIAEYHAVLEHARSEQHKILKEMADAAVELISVLDSRNGQLGFDIKDIRKPIDNSLDKMDGNLIARRTRDVLRHAATRVAMAGYGIEELRNAIVPLKTGVQLLQPGVERSYKGYMESYTIGSNPTEKEIEAITDHKGKNPRQLDYEYETDNDSSDEEQENEPVSSVDKSLVIQRPLTTRKPSAKTPAGRRLSDEVVID